VAIVRATDNFSFFFSLLVISSASFPFLRFCAIDVLVRHQESRSPGPDRFKDQESRIKFNFVQ
jgi:hypothetical protein